MDFSEACKDNNIQEQNLELPNILNRLDIIQNEYDIIKSQIDFYSKKIKDVGSNLLTQIGVVEEINDRTYLYRMKNI